MNIEKLHPQCGKPNNLKPLFTPFRYPRKLLLSSNCGKLEIKMILYGYGGVEGMYLDCCIV